MRRILIVNGPNLNLLGTRQPDVYGSTTLDELDERCREWGTRHDVEVETFQSNHEGALTDRLHESRGTADAVVINPGALAHYSYALRDAVEAIETPTVEVHISNVKAREAWRARSVISPVCVRAIYGRGIEGYRDAIGHLVHRAARPVTEHGYGAGRDQVGDLRLPDGPGPYPVVAVLHGGFWHDPWQRDLMDGAAVDLAGRGYATWNLEYRRLGAGGGWPTTFLDVAAGIDALSSLAEEHRLDLGRVVAFGHSAGGHLALWTAARSGLDDGDPGAGPKVGIGAIVATAPIPDLAAGYRLGLYEDAVRSLLRRSPEEAPARYRVASPAERLPLGVPQRILHGTGDRLVPIELSRDYVAVAAESGDDARLVELEGAGHFRFLDTGSEEWQHVTPAFADLLPPS